MCPNSAQFSHGPDAAARSHSPDRQTALAELGHMAIVARDVAALRPEVSRLLRHHLGPQIDVDAIVHVNGRLHADAPQLKSLNAEDAGFVSAIGYVLSLLARQREHQQSELMEVQGRFGRIFQLSPVALAMSTIDEGRIIDANERWLSLFGYQRHEVIGRTNAELRITEGLAQRSEISSAARTIGVVRDLEIKVRKKSGEIVDISAAALPLEIPGAGQEVWLSALVDITDHKRATDERDQLLAREQLARAEAEQALEKVRAVFAIADPFAGHAPLGELLSEVLRRLRRTLQVDHATVLLLDDDRKMLSLRAIEGPNGTGAPSFMRVPMGSGVSGRIAAEGKPMIVNDYNQIDSSAIQSAKSADLLKTVSVMGAPFHIGDRVAGVVVVSTMRSRAFTEEELRLLLLAVDRVGPAIERGQLIDRIRSGQERQRALSRRLLTAQEEERRRLAVELHDELGQVLTAVKINLESLTKAKSPAGTFATMTATIQSVDDALLRVRDLALDLRPSVLDDLGLAAAIRWYVDRFARGGPIETHLSIDVLPALEPGLETACFRIAQEALTNVDRHARARQVWIDLHVLAGALELSVRDDGTGFDVAAARSRATSGESVGLLGMQERVSLLDGEYEIVRVPTGGTEVRARFPLAASVKT